MLTIHHLGFSQSERIIWLCEELGLPYELIRYEREASMAAPAAYKALHPAGTAPTITDGDFTLAESGAIIDYLTRARAGGRLTLGPEHPEFANYLFWFHFANGSVLPAFMMDMTAQRLGSAPASSRSDIAFALADKRLGETPYFGGADFTAADIMMGFPLTRARAFSKRDISGLPHLRAYLQRIGARPAFQTAMAKAEPKMAPLLD